jgi:hypothetical protein
MDPDQAKRKTLIPTVFLLYWDFLSLKNDVRSMTKIAGSGSEYGSISQRHGSADPDPHQNAMDPEHCLKVLSRYIGTSVSDPNPHSSALVCFEFFLILASAKRKYIFFYFKFKGTVSSVRWFFGLFIPFRSCIFFPSLLHFLSAVGECVE